MNEGVCVEQVVVVRHVVFLGQNENKNKTCADIWPDVWLI